MAKPECPICFGPFQRGQHIFCCRNDTCHNVHQRCQRDNKCCLCRSVGMRRNRLLEGLYDDGTYASESQNMAFEGGTYNGEWKDNLPHGEGTKTYLSGAVYKGQWKGGQRDGEGTYTYSSGTVYKGQFKKGQRDGEGIQTYSDGIVYKGQWKEDKRDGEGTCTYSEGAVYKGLWKSHRIHDGELTIPLPDGNRFTLVYSKGKRQKGIEIRSDGKVFNRVYSKGRLLSETESSDSNSQSSTDDVSVLGKRSREEIIEDNIKVVRARNEIIDVSQ